MKMEDNKKDTNYFCTFTIEDSQFAVPILKVQAEAACLKNGFVVNVYLFIYYLFTVWLGETDIIVIKTACKWQHVSVCKESVFDC